MSLLPVFSMLGPMGAALLWATAPSPSRMVSISGITYVETYTSGATV